jgi:predicted peptidase
VPLSFSDPAGAVGRLEYLFYLPRDYEAGEATWPLLLFLHGAGERGGDLDAVKRHGPPKLIEQGQDLPFLIASPQCPAQHWWVEEDFQRVLWELQMDLTERYAVDRDRVCLTGISMGGFGAWMLAARRPECFAALVPVCGGGDPVWAARLRDVPIWAFHGAKDDVVALDFSVRMVKSVRAAGGEVEFTIYPELGHDSWTPTYENPDVWRWLLKQQRTGPAKSRKPR